MSDPNCSNCRGFGYTKGAPGAPWEKVDCKACAKPYEPPVSSKNKNVVLFWLKRHERELTAKAEAPDQVSMAEAGLSYSQRIARLQAAEGAQDSSMIQLLSIRAAIAFIEETVR